MGKGQRAREARAQEIIDNPQKAVKKKKNNKKNTWGWLTPVVTVLVVLLIVGVFVMNYVSSSGILLRSKTAMESENYKIDGAMMKFAVMSTYQNFANSNQEILQYLGLDTSKRLDAQPYGNGTWLDYFKDSAEASLKQVLVYAEGAKAAGIELSDEDIKLINDNIDMYEYYAMSNGYTLDAYLALVFGKGVKAKDIKNFYEISTLSAKYSEQVATEAEDAITEDTVKEYYLTVQASEALADVLMYKETVKLPATMSAADKDARKAELRAAYEAIAAAKTDEEFKTNLREYLATVEYEKEVTGEDGKKTTEMATYTEDEINDLIEKASATISHPQINIEDASKWMFEEDASHVFLRAVGDTKMFEKAENEAIKSDTTTNTDTETETDADADTDTEAETTDDNEKEEDKGVSKDGVAQTFDIAVYRIVKTPYRDEAPTKNVGHILVTADTYGSDDKAKAKADEILAEFLANDEKTKEKFEEIANKYTEDSSVFYDNVKTGDMVAEYNDWLFDSSRKEGDTGIVKTSYGYHVMYFVGEGFATWYADSYNAVLEKNISDAYTALEKKHVITTNESALNSIKG